jgi:hypothetical protein
VLELALITVKDQTHGGRSGHKLTLP